MKKLRIQNSLQTGRPLVDDIYIIFKTPNLLSLKHVEQLEFER
jgi:hypothetical protein